MAESGPARCENASSKSDRGPTEQQPPTTTGINSSSADKREGNSATRNDSREKAENIAAEQVEKDGGHHQYRQRPRQGQQQSRSSGARTREVFEVRGGKWRGQRWRGEYGDRRRRERGEGERETAGEGEERGATSRGNRGRDRFDENVGRQEFGGRGMEMGEAKMEGGKETISGREKHEEGKRDHEVPTKTRQREYGGRRRGRGEVRAERERIWEQEKGEGEGERLNEGQQKPRRREYGGRRKRGDGKTEQQETTEQEKEKQKNEVGEGQGGKMAINEAKIENSEQRMPNRDAKKTENLTSDDRKGVSGGIEGSEKSNPRKPRQRRQLKETQVRERKPRYFDRNWREGSDQTETETRPASERRYMYDTSVPGKRIKNSKMEDGIGGEEERGLGGKGREGEGERRPDTKVKTEKEGDKRGHKRSSRSATQKKGRDKQVTTPSLQSSELTEQLTSGSYCCMVCCDRVRDRDAVWSCKECYHVFHLGCIRKWATAPAALVSGKEPSEGWRCPACQNPSDVVPTVYKCYCGKLTNPRPKARGELTVPHSCGELCGRSLARNPLSSCQHKCQLLCHPGPCPPCPMMVNRSCPCGRQNYQVRCSKGEELSSCGSECGRRMKCGRHHCTQSCHSGSCGDCTMMLTQHCHCGRSQREVVCGETGEKGEEERYGCSLVCGRELNCGNHLCELSCHPAPCPPCPLLPSHVTACPCGATPLSALLSPDQSRTSCLDPVPTCDRSCGRVLPCSTKAEPHFCPAGCHEGPCPRCEKSRLVRCRCGRGSTRVDCQKLEGVGDFICDKPCNKMKSCGRHRCNTRCCMDANHQCTLVCGKRLRCGIHNCMQQCHRGHCEQCWEYSYEELTCHCGAEVLYPPLPCGTRPPTCKRVCARMHSCDHPVSHSCHNEEECPPCTVLTVKICMGEHEKRYNIPCHIADVSCGMPCGKDLPCGRHKCLKLCHRGVCMDSPAQCRQACQTPRKYCSHVCGETCHVGSDCPDIACKAEVVLTCKCGRMKERVLCAASSSGVMQQAFHKILSKDLGAKIRDLQSGQSVSLGRVSLASLSRDRDSLDCDELCAQIERNKALAEALGIASPVLDPLESPLPKYLSTLLDQARRDTAVAASLEEELKSFVDTVMKSQGPGDHVRRHKFQPMANHERRMVHELAPHYGCDSLSYDSEPLRHVTVSTKKSRAKFPTLSLVKMLDKVRLKVATPTPVNLPSERGSSPAKILGPLEIDRTKIPAVREPVTDYFADNLS